MAVVAVGARSVAQPSGTKEMCRRKEGESEEIAYVVCTTNCVLVRKAKTQLHGRFVPKSRLPPAAAAATAPP